MRALLVLALLGGVAAAQDQGEFEVKTGGDVAATAGEPGAASLTVTPLPGHALHRGAGVTIRLTAPKGLELKKRRLGLADAADPRADAPRFDLPFTAAAPGDYTLGADVRFWICAVRTCRPVRTKTEIKITATAKAAP